MKIKSIYSYLFPNIFSLFFFLLSSHPSSLYPPIMTIATICGASISTAGTEPRTLHTLSHLVSTITCKFSLILQIKENVSLLRVTQLTTSRLVPNPQVPDPVAYSFVPSPLFSSQALLHYPFHITSLSFSTLFSTSLGTEFTALADSKILELRLTGYFKHARRRQRGYRLPQGRV